MWNFSELGIDDERSGEKNSEFFNAQKDATSIVRESIQNSLDAKANTEDKQSCVRLVYRFIEIKKEMLLTHLEADGNSNLLDHCASHDLKKHRVENLPEKIKCLVIEDFGTTGLTGPLDHLNTNNKGHFIGFWWTKGISGKGKGSTGSHGVGKSVFSSSSLIYTFFGLTKRNDDEKSFLIGFCGLPYHTLDDKPFKGAGRFGFREDESKPLNPIDDSKVIERFKTDFCIQRDNEKEYGLSIVIPHLRSDVSPDSIFDAIFEDYYMAIINGALEVEIIHQNGNTIKLDKGNFLEVIGNKDISRKALYASEAIKMRSESNNCYFSGITPISDDHNLKLKQSSFTPKNLTEIKKHYQAGKMVAIQVPLKIAHKEHGEISTRIDIFIKNDQTDNSKIDQYVRNNIVISGESSSIRSAYTFAMLLADDPIISEYLKHAEEPSHRHWYQNRLNKEKIYSSDIVLRFIKTAVIQFFQILSGLDEDEDEIKGVASDIFSIDEPVSKEPLKKNKNKKINKRNNLEGKGIEVITTERKKELLIVDSGKIGEGIYITASKELTEVISDDEIHLPLSFVIHMGYRIPMKTPKQSIDSYESFDFSFKGENKLSVEKEGGCKILEYEENWLRFEVLEKNFKVNIHGFDGLRDVSTMCNLETTLDNNEAGI